MLPCLLGITIGFNVVISNGSAQGNVRLNVAKCKSISEDVPSFIIPSDHLVQTKSDDATLLEVSIFDYNLYNLK